MRPEILPIVLMVIDVAAGVTYAIHGDIPRLAYWLSAAAITGSTLFIK